MKTGLICLLIALALVPASARANTGDFTGGVAIGSSYAGVNTAPTNGLIIQGNVGIGNTSPSDTLDLGAAGTATGIARLEGATSGYVRIAPSAAAGSWTLTLPGNAGSSGYVLSTDGSGVTTWIANDAGGTSPLQPGGRLSLSSSAAVQTADVTAAAAIYYLPYASQLVPVYNGTDWQELDIGSSGISLTLSPAEEAAGSMFDVYVLNNSSAATLCAMNWGGTTARSTTAGGTGGAANASVTQLNGVWVNNAAIASANCYNGTTSYAISQNQGTLLGSFYTPTSASSSLASTITSGTTSLSLSTTSINGPGLIGVNYYEALDSTTSTEYVLVTGGWNTTTQTVTRGQLGTTAISHSSGKTVAVAGGQDVVQFEPSGLSGGTGTLVGLSNIYNTVSNTAIDVDSHTGFTYATASWEIYDNNANNKIYFIDPLLRIAGYTSGQLVVKNSNSSGSWCNLGAGHDTTTGPSTPGMGTAYMSGTADQTVTLVGTFYPTLGLHYVAPLVYANGGTCTYLDAGGGNTQMQLTIPY